MNAKGKLGLAVCTAILITFLVGSSAMAVSKGGTVTFAQTGEPFTIDPPNQNTGPDEEAIKMLYEGFVRFSREKEKDGILELEPSLATSWEQSSDGLTWIFRLRKGVHFHDETPFNADAVVYCFNRSLSSTSKTIKGWGLFGDIVKSVEAVDSYTVKVNMRKPHAFFLNRLAHVGGYFFSPAAHKKFGENMAFNAMGTGPFRLSEWIKGDHITLVANKDYWGGTPYLDKIIVKFVSEPATRVLQLETGQIDVTTHIPLEALSRLKNNKKVEVLTYNSNSAIKVTMNTQLSDPPLKNKLVRQALNYAVDKEAIAKHLYEGLAVVIPGSVSPAIMGYAAIPGYPYNPSRAKELLAKAGYPNGFSMTILVSGGGQVPKDIALSEILQKYLAAVGVKLKIEKMEWGAIKSLCRLPLEQTKFQSTLEHWPPSTGEATWMFDASCTKKAWPPAGTNSAFYDNPAFDELLTKSMSSPDVKKRDEYLRAAQVVLGEDPPFIFLFTPKRISAKSRKLHDWGFPPLSIVYATERTWIEK